MRALTRSRAIQAFAAVVACAVVLAAGYVLGAVTVAGPDLQAGPALVFDSIPPESLRRVGLVFVIPSAAQAGRVPVSREQAIAAAEENSPGFVTKEAHLADWHENAGSPSEDD